MTGAGTSRTFLEGSAAIAEAMIAAGCRFFAGYPMTPFTEVLEHMARRLPEVGGVCMNAESELEAIGMAWGAAATGTPTATGSTGQGLSLMQESLAEITYARLPLVVLNMARAQGDYYQATRGGGHGDYRHIVLAPMDVTEAVELTQLAFHLAATWRNPVLVIGDYYLAHTWQTVDVGRRDFGPRPTADWALDGSSGGTGRARLISPIADTKRVADSPVDRPGAPGGSPGLEPGYDLAEFYARRVREIAHMTANVTPLVDCGYLDGAAVVVVAFGTAGKYVRYAVAQMRREGQPVGYVRPVTLFPFPAEAVATAAQGAQAVAVFENNQGQMIDDVRLAVAGRTPVHFIGGLSLDSSGFGIAPDLDVDVIRRRIGHVLAGSR